MAIYRVIIKKNLKCLFDLIEKLKYFYIIFFFALSLLFTWSPREWCRHNPTTKLVSFTYFFFLLWKTFFFSLIQSINNSLRPQQDNCIEHVMMLDVEQQIIVAYFNFFFSKLNSLLPLLSIYLCFSLIWTLIHSGSLEHNYKEFQNHMFSTRTNWNTAHQETTRKKEILLIFFHLSGLFSYLHERDCYAVFFFFGCEEKRLLSVNSLCWCRSKCQVYKYTHIYESERKIVKPPKRSIRETKKKK